MSMETTVPTREYVYDASWGKLPEGLTDWAYVPAVAVGDKPISVGIQPRINATRDDQADDLTGNSGIEKLGK